MLLTVTQIDDEIPTPPLNELYEILSHPPGTVISLKISEMGKMKIFSNHDIQVEINNRTAEIIKFLQSDDQHPPERFTVKQQLYNFRDAVRKLESHINNIDELYNILIDEIKSALDFRFKTLTPRHVKIERSETNPIYEITILDPNSTLLSYNPLYYFGITYPQKGIQIISSTEVPYLSVCLTPDPDNEPPMPPIIYESNEHSFGRTYSINPNPNEPNTHTLSIVLRCPVRGTLIKEA